MAEAKKTTKTTKSTVAKKESANKIKVTYTKSCIGYNKNQAKVLESLGLKKLNDSNVLPDNEAVRGMIFKVKHLVSVENV
ncbi:MAG: 50S ribosomal protein L30 [Clostridia bacterium]|nr:50S ribosomal protein L30 [Clostridia bacterium]